MKAAQSFNDILALRGRIAVFTPTAALGLKCEEAAARQYAQVIVTRGIVDKYTPMVAWKRIHASREFGLLSLDQHGWVSGRNFPATDLVWVGEMGHPKDAPHIWIRFSQAMNRATLECNARLWTIAEGAV